MECVRSPSLYKMSSMSSGYSRQNSRAHFNSKKDFTNYQSHLEPNSFQQEERLFHAHSSMAIKESKINEGSHLSFDVIALPPRMLFKNDRSSMSVQQLVHKESSQRSRDLGFAQINRRKMPNKRKELYHLVPFEVQIPTHIFPKPKDQLEPSPELPFLEKKKEKKNPLNPNLSGFKGSYMHAQQFNKKMKEGTRPKPKRDYLTKIMREMNAVKEAQMHFQQPKAIKIAF